MATVRITPEEECLKVRLHCSCFPLILVPGVVEEVQTSYGVRTEINRRSSGSATISDLRTSFRKISDPMLKILSIKDYVNSVRPVVVEFQWKAIDDQGEFKPVHDRVNWYLNNAYYLSGERQETFMHDSRNYIVNFRSHPSTLTDRSTGVVRQLKRKPNPPQWSYSLPENGGFAPHSRQDSESIEQMFRYGGDHVVLAGIKHTINFTSSAMFQIDLETGERVPVKRFPLASASSVPSLPDFEFSLKIFGRGAETAKEDLQRRTESHFHTTQVSCRLPESLSQTHQENVMTHMVNISRQYCVQVTPQPIQNRTVCIELRGVRDCVERVELLLKKESLDFQQNMLSMNHYVSPSSSSLPEWWEPQTENLHLPSIREGSEEWLNVLRRMQRTMPTVEIVQMQRIQNRPLWDKYELERRQMSDRNSGMVNELQLFHGTRSTDPRMVIRSVRGIDFRCSSRDKQLLWGTGAYFAVNASYSHNYSFYFVGHRQMLLVRVLTGNSYAYGGTRNPNLTRPPPLLPHGTELYDTVNGMSGDSLVYVVYDHDRAYPAYLITYIYRP